MRQKFSSEIYRQVYLDRESPATATRLPASYPAHLSGFTHADDDEEVEQGDAQQMPDHTSDN